MIGAVSTGQALRHEGAGFGGWTCAVGMPKRPSRPCARLGVGAPAILTVYSTCCVSGSGIVPDEITVFVTMPGSDEQWSRRFEGTAVAGRDTACDVCLPHPLVSRRHAEFSRTSDGDVVIRDLGSRNGTTVDDSPLRAETYTTRGRATVRIGPYVVVVSAEVVPNDLTLPLGSVVAAPFRTILFTDVEDSTRLTDRFGDERARDILRAHERIVRDALRAHGGTEHKTMGDGFMASFASAGAALDAAIAMQRAITSHFAQSDAPIRIRIGVNAGEPIEEQDDLHGAAVIRAARHGRSRRRRNPGHRRCAATCRGQGAHLQRTRAG